MKILVIDGQSGRLGKLLVEGLRQAGVAGEILAVGTNSIATASMIKAGATAGATGENSVVVCAREADVILGPIGLLSADSLMGEITGTMALAVGRSPAKKILIPLNRCRTTVAGTKDLTMSELVQEAVELTLKTLSCQSGNCMVD